MNKKNKILSAFLAVLLLFSVMSVTAFADGNQTVTTSAPCTVTLQVGDHGKVTVNSTDYTGNASFTAAVGTALTYTFTPNTLYKVDKVIYNGTDVTGVLSGKTYTAPAIAGNASLSVSFKLLGGGGTNTCTVTFNANGHGTAPASQTVLSGNKAAEPAAPTASGWTFGGWYKDSSCKETQKFDFNTAITADTTIYAKWTQNTTPPVPVTYTVTFNANGGSVTPESSKTGTDGRLSALPSPVRAGYDFTGWYTAASGGTKVTSSNVFTADTLLYAHWERSSYGGGSSSGGSGGGGGIAVSGSVRSSSVPSWVEKAGTWSQDAEGAWSYTNNGVMYRNCWACVYNPYANSQAGQRMYDWFWFDGNAKMYAGWLDWTDGNRYYLNPVHDGTYGAMLTGWKEIDGKWYYFNGTEGSGSMGAMLLDTTTPDGYRIGADGVWMP